MIVTTSPESLPGRCFGHWFRARVGSPETMIGQLDRLLTGVVQVENVSAEVAVTQPGEMIETTLAELRDR